MEAQRTIYQFADQQKIGARSLLVLVETDSEMWTQAGHKKSKLCVLYHNDVSCLFCCTIARDSQLCKITETPFIHSSKHQTTENNMYLFLHSERRETRHRSLYMAFLITSPEGVALHPVVQIYNLRHTSEHQQQRNGREKGRQGEVGRK